MVCHTAFRRPLLNGNMKMKTQTHNFPMDMGRPRTVPSTPGHPWRGSMYRCFPYRARAQPPAAACPQNTTRNIHLGASHWRDPPQRFAPTSSPRSAQDPSALVCPTAARPVCASRPEPRGPTPPRPENAWRPSWRRQRRTLLKTNCPKRLADRTRLIRNRHSQVDGKCRGFA